MSRKSLDKEQKSGRSSMWQLVRYCKRVWDSEHTKKHERECKRDWALASASFYFFSLKLRTIYRKEVFQLLTQITKCKFINYTINNLVQCKSQNNFPFIFEKQWAHLLGNTLVPLLLLWPFHISSQEFLCKKTQPHHISSLVSRMKVTTDTESPRQVFKSQSWWQAIQFLFSATCPV